LTDTTTHVGSRTDGEQVGAHGGKLLADALLGTLTNSHHDDNCCYTDDNTQHREEGAHLVVGNGLEANLK
jgi:hypothetical protein